MRIVIKLFAFLVGLVFSFCSQKNGDDLKPLFEAILLSDLAKEKPVWVIAESDAAANRTMFGIEICSWEFFRRSFQGKNRMDFGNREAKMTIWDCAGTCLTESKAYRFTPEDFPEGVEFISQSYLDSLKAVVDSKGIVDSLKSDALSKLHFQTRFRFSKPIFFGGGDYALLYYTQFTENSGYVVMERKSGKWEEVFREIYTHF